MRIRNILFTSVFFGAGLVVYAGCGDEDEGAPATSDAGNDASQNPDGTVSPTDAASDARSPEHTGSACTAPTDCYGDLDGAALVGGPAVCLDRVTGGYCTHECQQDSDCCAVPGECKTGLKQVCAPFESTGKKYCFLSCDDRDIAAANDAGASDAGALDGGGFSGDDYCHANASTEFGCRSTGGGAENRKACLPTGTGDGGAGDGGGGGGKKDAGADAGDGGDGG